MDSIFHTKIQGLSAHQWRFGKMREFLRPIQIKLQTTKGIFLETFIGYASCTRAPAISELTTSLLALDTDKKKFAVVLETKEGNVEIAPVKHYTFFMSELLNKPLACKTISSGLLVYEVL